MAGAAVEALAGLAAAALDEPPVLVAGAEAQVALPVLVARVEARVELPVLGAERVQV